VSGSSHAIGLIFSIVALVLLVRHASLHGNDWHIASFGILQNHLTGRTKQQLFLSRLSYTALDKIPLFRQFVILKR
jgi:predicted membrane channel-forming protein YqfA (hemolysin III family)